MRVLGVIWNSSLQYKDAIIKDINTMAKVLEKKDVMLIKNFKNFFIEFYNYPKEEQWKSEYKYNDLKIYKERKITILKIEIEDSCLIYNKKMQLIDKNLNELKEVIREKYQKKLNQENIDIYSENIFHLANDEKESKYQLNVIEKYGKIFVNKYVENIESAYMYDKLPPYSIEGIKFIFDQYLNDKKNDIVAEIGSGTGKLIGSLLQYNKKVYAVEPDELMRYVSDSKYNNYNNYKSINGNSYMTNLKDKSIDAIFIAQTLHLFEKNSFLKECKRILKENGIIVVIWNRYDYNKKIFKEMIDALLECYSSCELRYDKTKVGNSFNEERKLNIESCDELINSKKIKTFDNSIIIEKEKFLELALSFEIYPLCNLGNIYNTIENNLIDIDNYRKKMIDIFNEYSIDGKITLPIYTDFIYGEVLK